MESLSNQLLAKSYQKAKELKLDEHFILLLKQEMNRRKINRDNPRTFSGYKKSANALFSAVWTGGSRRR